MSHLKPPLFMWKICYCFQLQKFSLLHNHILVESIFQEDFISIFSKISPAVNHSGA